MPVLTPTKTSGARAKPMDGLYVEPQRQVTDESLESAMTDTGLDTGYLADLLSGVAAHERASRKLMRSCAERSNNPMLQMKYRQIGDAIEEHLSALEQMTLIIGGDPLYMAPMARGAQGMGTAMIESTFLGSGSIDPMTAESLMLDAVFMAAAMNHANWSTMTRMCDHMSEGDAQDQFRQVVGEVEESKDEHLAWARETRERMIMLQARSSVAAAVGARAEDAMARIRSWFSSDS